MIALVWLARIQARRGRPLTATTSMRPRDATVVASATGARRDLRLRASPLAAPLARPASSRSIATGSDVRSHVLSPVVPYFAAIASRATRILRLVRREHARPPLDPYPARDDRDRRVRPQVAHPVRRLPPPLSR